MGVNIESMEQMYQRLSQNKQQLHFEADADVNIEEADIAEHMRTSPSVCLKWGRLSAFAEMVEAQCEDVLKRVKAETYLKIRKESTEKLSEAMTDAKVVSHPDYVAALDVYRKAQETALFMKKTEKALYDRSNLLVSLNNRQMKELRDSFGKFGDGRSSPSSSPAMSDEELAAAYRQLKQAAKQFKPGE